MVVVCKQFTVCVFQKCSLDIERNVTCQNFNYHLTHSRHCPPLLCLICLYGTLLLWGMHYSVQQLVTECWSKTPFPVLDLFIQMWQLWKSCLNALQLKVWVDYKIRRYRDVPVSVLSAPIRQMSHILLCCESFIDHSDLSLFLWQLHKPQICNNYFYFKWI